MGLFSFMKSQFIDVIEWTDTPSKTIVHLIPTANQSIRMGATLIVRESQVAVIVNEGKVADVFEPGKYTLSQQNLSILSVQRSWKQGFKSTFKVDIYYVNTKQFTDLNWGTVNPLKIKSDIYGDIRTKAKGTFTFRVLNADKFMKGIFGINQIYDTSYIIGQLKSKLIVGLSDVLNTTKLSVHDFTSQYDELSESTENQLQEEFASHGLELCSFIIESIQLPVEVAEFAGGATEVQEGTLVATIIADSTKAVPGSTVMPSSEPEEAESSNQVNQTKCHGCGHPMAIAMKFCSDCGVEAKQEYLCSCGLRLDYAMKYCPDCGVKV